MSRQTEDFNTVFRLNPGRGNRQVSAYEAMCLDLAGNPTPVLHTTSGLSTDTLRTGAAGEEITTTSLPASPSPAKAPKRPAAHSSKGQLEFNGCYMRNTVGGVTE